MASGTIYGSTGNQYIDSKIEWSYSQSTSANTSTVTATLYYKRNNTGFTTKGTGTFTISIGGKATSESKYLTITESAWVKAVEATETISHNSDGTKSVAISASGSIPSTSLTSTSCSGTVKLATIARASTIASASNKTLGNACSVKWTPLSKSFRYKLKFTLGDWSYTTGAIHPNTTSAYTYAGYTLPLAVAEQLPKAKTGTMTVALYTYSDSGATTQVGSASSKTFTVTVPNNSSTKPSVSMTLAAVNSLGSAFSGLYIKGLSKVKATFTGSGKYSADISSYNMSVLGKSYSSPYQSGYLSSSGTVTVTGKATDSRGYSNTVEKDITVLPYSKPTILPASGESAIICARCDSNGNLTESGTYLKIKARRSYSTVTSGGAQKNFCAIRYRYVTEGSKFSGDDGWVTLLAGSTTSTNTVDKTLSGVVSSTETAYVVQVGVVDDIGYSDVVQFTIPTDFVTIDVPEVHKGRRIGVGRHVSETEEDGVYVGLPIFGGSVDSLKLGTPLLATADAPIDLNDVRTPGCYYSPGSTYSQYITNSPYTTGGFGLEVRELQSKTYLRQTLYYGRTTLIRHWNNSTWSDWLRYMVTPEVDSSVVDFVTDIGVSFVDPNDNNKGYWRYRKWKSKALDINGYLQVFPVTDTGQGTDKGYWSQLIEVELPFSVENFQYTGVPATNFVFFANANMNGDNTIRFRLFRFTDFGSVSETGMYVRIMASGKYK